MKKPEITFQRVGPITAAYKWAIETNIVSATIPFSMRATNASVATERVGVTGIDCSLNSKAQAPRPNPVFLSKE